MKTKKKERKRIISNQFSLLFCFTLFYCAVMLCCYAVMLCYAMLCYTILCYVILCFVLFHYSISYSILLFLIINELQYHNHKQKHKQNLSYFNPENDQIKCFKLEFIQLHFKYVMETRMNKEKKRLRK